MGMKSSKYGGLERFMENLVKRDNNNKYYIIYNAPIVNKEYRDRLVANNVTLLNWSVCGLKNMFIFALRFFILLIKERPDIVHVHFEPAGYIALLISYILRVKKRIKTVHSGILDKKTNIVVYKRSQISFKTYYLFKLMSFLSTHVICVSHAIKAQMLKIWNFKRNISVVYLGVERKVNDKSKDEIRKKYNFPIGKILIANVAFHDDIKGIDLLLKSFAIVKEKYENIVLIQIGQFKDRTKFYKQLSSKLKIDNSILWMGVQDNVQEILYACDIYTQPSRSEGIGLAIMEASSVGIPTVAYNVGGIPEACVNGKTGFLVPSNDFKSFADSLLYLLENEKERYVLGENAQKYMMTNFELNNAIDKLINIYWNEKNSFNN